jgi:hypothetical protein
MSASERQVDKLDSTSLPQQFFLIAILAGVGLRAIAGIWGDIGVYVDGASRIAMAMRWAEHPTWQGLSGVWPLAHIYALGILIRLWNQPVLLAKIIGFASGVGTIFVFRNAVRHRFGPTVASLSALLLAIYWTHIWLSSSYWVEVPYLLFVLLSVHYAERAKTTLAWRHALVSGVFLSLAMLLRNEALLLLVLFVWWYLIRIKTLKILAVFVTIPFMLAAWYFIEPIMRGGSYLDYFLYVARSKEFENVVENVSRKEALYQWILMLGASPTLIVVLPGLYGLWLNRRHAVTDLFAWMFMIQTVFYLSLTIVSGWRPQLRYLMLQFVNLFPYAALVWLSIMRRFSPRYLLPPMLALMIAMQGLAWWIGRNNGLPGGWLPLQVITSSQEKLDALVRQIDGNTQEKLVIISVVPGPRVERWSLEHSFIINRGGFSNVVLREADVHVEPDILDGSLPEYLLNADVLLIDPQAVFFSTVISSSRRHANLSIRRLHPHLEVVLMTERARKNVGTIVSSDQ